MTSPSDRYIEARGLKLHYLEWGEKAGVPLILIHGFLDHAHSWEPFVECLRSRCSEPAWIIAPDCRGHGDSGWVGDGGYYHFPDYVFDLDCLVRSLETSSVVLLGHSMGGTISFLYAGAFPERVQKLVLAEGLGPPGMDFSDAPLRVGKWISEVGASWRGKQTEYASLEDAAKRLQRTNPRLRPDLALSLVRWGMRSTGDGKWVWKFDPLHRTTAPQPFYLEQALEFLRRIVCPVLIVQGKESRQRRRADIQQRLAALERQKSVEIENAGHMIHHDNPEELARVVADFLSGR